MFQSWLSADSLLAAWRHVEENGGCAGADAVTITSFSRNLDDEIGELRHLVEGGRYRALPLLPIIVQKPDSSGTRTLLVPTVRDRVLQTAVGRQLGRFFEDEFLECSFAYRPKRSVNSAIARIRYLHRHGFRYVVEADIESFFDRIDHSLLRQRLGQAIADPVLLKLLEHWIAGPVWNGHAAHPLRHGIPQGAPISPLLANLFLSDFDLDLEQRGLILIRYADDFLLLSARQEQIAPSLEIAIEKLEALNLQLNSEKTKIGTFEEGFRFLGALFLGEGIWIPWEKHGRNRRVLAVPRPMPPLLVRRWLEPPRSTMMARAFAAAELEYIYHVEATEEPEMAFLYLMEQGSVLRKIGNRLVVEKDGSILLDTPYHKLESVLLFGNVQVTTQAMSELLDSGIRLSLLTRHGEFRGSLDPSRGKNVPLRIAQFELHRDTERSLGFAKALVGAKIANSAWVLAHFGDRELIRAQACASAVSQLQEWRENARTASTLAILNGIEGSAAHLYYDVLMRRNKSEFAWPGRIKHPATDPLNSMLSFAYTLVTNELAGLADAAGLDSYLGCLHQLDYGRHSLALDLVEPFRAPLADRLVLTMANRRQFSPSDFEGVPGGALYFRPEASKRFFAEYEHWMLHAALDGPQQGYRAALRKGVEDYMAAVRDGQLFGPFIMKEDEPHEEAKAASTP